MVARVTQSTGFTHRYTKLQDATRIDGLPSSYSGPKFIKAPFNSERLGFATSPVYLSMTEFFRLSAWSLEREDSKFGPSSRWSNMDMDPVTERDRTWSTWNYVAYWIADAANVATWQTASSMLAVGLSWRQALTAIVVGNIILAVAMVLNGIIGARLHISFPVLNRSSFGFWLSYFSVVSRVVLAMFWFGIQSYTGSECVYQMLKAIWPSISNTPNRLSPSANITTAGMMCYFLYWLLQFPLLFISPQNIRHFFNFKCVIVPAAYLSILIWATVKTPLSAALEPLDSNLHGSALSWAWLGALNSALGSYATLAVNIPDFTRYAKNDKAPLVQLVVIPLSFTLIGFIGIAVTSTAEVMYGEVIWDPLRLIDRWDNRAAAFFAAFSFAIGTIGTNISANSLSAANDMTVLFPQYLNIRRGQIICAVVGSWVLCPWSILSSAPGFLSFMAGYTVFLGPFTGIMIADFWVVHRGKVDVPAMYHPNGRYQYWHGINWRAAVALLCSITPTLPGLINNINPTIFVGNVSYLFNLSWLFGFFTAFSVYSVLSLVFRAEETFIEKAILAEEDVVGVSQHSSPHRDVDEKGYHQGLYDGSTSS